MPASPTARTTRVDRVRDAVALAFVVAGAVLILVSHAGMRRLATQPIVVAHGEFAIVRFERYSTVERWGFVVGAVGVAIGIASFVLHARRREGGSTTPPAT